MPNDWGGGERHVGLRTQSEVLCLCLCLSVSWGVFGEPPEEICESVPACRLLPVPACVCLCLSLPACPFPPACACVCSLMRVTSLPLSGPASGRALLCKPMRCCRKGEGVSIHTGCFSRVQGPGGIAVQTYDVLQQR